MHESYAVIVLFVTRIYFFRDILQSFYSNILQSTPVHDDDIRMCSTGKNLIKVEPLRLSCFKLYRVIPYDIIDFLVMSITIPMSK